VRNPDETTTQDWHGHELTVETWFDPCDHPWDGDGPAPAYEGVDLLVELTLNPDTTNLKAYGSLGGVYGDRAYVREEVANVVAEALASLQEELESVAAGRDVRLARDRQAQAIGLLKGVV
jgi:hypothetical protein